MTDAAKSPKGGAVQSYYLRDIHTNNTLLGTMPIFLRYNPRAGHSSDRSSSNHIRGPHANKTWHFLDCSQKSLRMQSKAGGSSNRPLLIRTHNMGGVATNYCSNSCQFLDVHLESRIYCPVIAEARKLARARWTSWTLRPLPDLPELPLPLPLL